MLLLPGYSHIFPLITQVNFENCWLNYVDASAFRGLSRLTEINLVNNELQTLDPDTEHSLAASSLRIFRLYRNPWTCNCRLRWLRRWVTSGPTASSDGASRVGTSSSEYSGGVHHDGAASSGVSINWDFASNTPTCAAPPLIKGVAWRHLTPDHFACPTRIISLSSGVPSSVQGQSANRSASVSSSSFAESSPGIAGAAPEIRAVSGRNATIECIAAGDPEPTITWSRDPDVPLAPGLTATLRHRGAGSGVGADGGESTVIGVLTLVTVNADRDFGDYRCTADNPAGRAEVSFRLTVVDAGSAIVPSGRVSHGGGGGDAGVRRATSSVDEEDDEVDGWSGVDRDALLGIVGGLFVLVGIITLFVACRPKLRDCVRRHRSHLERHRRNNKDVYKMNDYASSKPLNNVTVIGSGGGGGGGVTTLSPSTTAHTNNCNRKQHHGNNHCAAVVVGIGGRGDASELRLSEPEDVDKDDDDGGQYDEASCEEPLTRHSDGFRPSETGNSARSVAAVAHRRANHHNLLDDADDDDGDRNHEEEDVEEDVNAGSVHAVNDDESLSDQLSQASGDCIENGNDFSDAAKTLMTTAGDVGGRHERNDRSGRTVSFGPDLVLDADGGGKWSKSTNNDDDNDDDDDYSIGSDIKTRRQRTPASDEDLQASLPPVSALKLCKSGVMTELTPTDVAETSSLSLSSSSTSTHSGRHRISVPDNMACRRTVNLPPSCTAGIPFSSMAANHGSGEVRLLPVGRPCIMWPKTEDARCRSIVSGPRMSGRRHSGGGGCGMDPSVRHINGSVLGPPLCPSQSANRHRAMPTCIPCAGGIPLISAYSSLERPSTRRRLPLQPGTVDDLFCRRDCATGTGVRTATLPRIGNGGFLGNVTGGAGFIPPCVPCLGNRATGSAAATATSSAPYTLADILAPPFGAAANHTGSWKPKGVGGCGANETNRKYEPIDVDDDSGTAII